MSGYFGSETRSGGGTDPLSGQSSTDMSPPEPGVGVGVSDVTRAHGDRVPSSDSMYERLLISRYGTPNALEGRICTACGASRSVELTVREHTDCGYISADLFLCEKSEELPVCLKCGADNRDGLAFDAIGVVHTCVGCGQILDRPLGNNLAGQWFDE